MSSISQPDAAPRPDLGLARQVLTVEADAVRSLVDRLDGGFCRAAELIYACTCAAGGAVITTGIGKAGLIAQKISATLASTGTPSSFLHPVEAVHGDIGRLRDCDVLLALSHSGETDEIVRLVNVVRKLSAPLIALTASAESTLGRYSDVVLATGSLAEACPLGLAPTASTTAMLALGDALALVVMRMRNFTPEKFAEFHPGGQLGRLLLRVEEAMGFRTGVNLPLFDAALSVREVLRQADAIKRVGKVRLPGAVLLSDESGRLAGIFTDGDLRRLLIGNDPAALDRPVRQVMIGSPRRIRAGQLVSAAVALFNQYRIDELPVVDENDRPIGLIDVQDIVALKLL